MAQRPSSSSSLSTLLLFFALSAAILFGHRLIVANFFPPAPPVAQAPAAPAEKEKPAEKPKSVEPVKPESKEAKPHPKEAKTGDGKTAAKPDEKKSQPEAEKPAQNAEQKVEAAWATLGSADPDSPYRMLVTLSNRGAALARIELNNDRYRELQDRTGYFGHVVMVDDGRPGAPVQVVGPGTPAAEAGLKPGDRIMAITLPSGREIEVKDAAGLDVVLAQTRPDEQITLFVVRDGKLLEPSPTARLRRRPLEVVRPELREPQPLPIAPADRRLANAIHPEKNSPLSLLATLEQIDDQKLPDEDSIDAALGQELDGVDLRTANWQIDPQASNQEQVVFHRTLKDGTLKLTKTYRLVPIPAEHQADPNYRAYDLVFTIQIENVDPKQATHTVAYQLDGTNGLPDEGAWYASKVSQPGVWSASGMRDVLAQRWNTNFFEQTTAQVADKGLLKFDKEPERPLVCLAVDAQYFTTALLPNRKDKDEENAPQIDRAMAIRVGDVDPERKNVTNTSFRLVSQAREVKPGKPLVDQYTLFAGPKRPDLLEQYGIRDVVTYGWPIFWAVAKPLTYVLHFFYAIVGNYGLAIILLTVVVRLCMFPLSLKQTHSAQKMQQLQPEMKKLQEKFKKDPEGRMRAQQELFRKHNVNPLGGCLPMFIQLPIFIGLYRALQIDVELRGAALLSHSVRWCSNLAAPDMLFDWSWFMPEFISRGVGFFGLGPYFNLLPILTIGLFIAQQKMFMPPPADEQAAMQQKMMNFMMIFMGLLFFKVAAGLCIYFIASSLWGMAERKFLPKTAAAAEDDGTTKKQKQTWFSAATKPDGAATRKKKNRKR